MKPLLEDKVVLITGAASGIGRECALACVRDGALVMIADVNAAQAEETAHDLGERVAACFCDVADGAAVENAVRETLARFSRLDAIHNNAGIASPSLLLEETTEEDSDRLMAVNLKSVYWTTRFALPY
ncbi:MAG: SDR family NAD(P)-dependent oxidoreductase, partial [Acidobacteriaceae bacterium]|nr:SDR family NAD(P)-dependent oxidoreductase [Acidobacteriaceae bacterium]